LTIRDLYNINTLMVKHFFLSIIAILCLASCQKEKAAGKNVEKLLSDQYKESEYFYSTNLTDFQAYIQQYISQNPQTGLYPSFDSIRRIKVIVDRTLADIDHAKDKQKLINDSREEISRLSNYKFEFVDLKLLNGLNDTLYNQAIKTDLLKANYNIYLQYSHDKMKQ